MGYTPFSDIRLGQKLRLIYCGKLNKYQQRGDTGYYLSRFDYSPKNFIRTYPFASLTKFSIENAPTPPRTLFSIEAVDRADDNARLSNFKDAEPPKVYLKSEHTPKDVKHYYLGAFFDCDSLYNYDKYGKKTQWYMNIDFVAEKLEFVNVAYENEFGFQPGLSGDDLFWVQEKGTYFEGKNDMFFTPVG